MPDAQIHPLGTEDTPAGYKIPDTAELLLKGAYASFDGSNAAGPYIPLLRVISDAGTVSLEAPADTTLAAGASVDQSWFPRVAAAGQSSAGFATSWATLFDNAITVPSGATFTQYDFTPAAFYTNDSTTFTVDATNGLGLHSVGWYQLTATLQWEVDSAPTGYAEMLWSIPNIGHRTSYCTFVDDAGVDGLATTYHSWGFPMKDSTVGSAGKLFLRQFGASDATCGLSFGIALMSDSHGNF